MADADIEQFLLGNGEPDRNPITAFNFVLEVEAVYFLPLKSVRAFTKENEYEYIREGGLNDYVHLRRKQASKPFTFQVERYIGTDRFLDPIANGTELLLPLILHVYRHKAMQGFGSKNLPDAWPARLFIFTGCTVISKEYGELNAEKSALITETTTFAYRELIVLNNSLTDIIKQLGFDAKALSPELAEWRFKDAYEAGKGGEDIYKDPEDERNHAVRATGNSNHPDPVEWKMAKDNTQVLRGRQSQQDVNYTPENGYNQVLTGIGPDGQETTLQNSRYDITGEDRDKPVRGRQAVNSDDRAEVSEWQMAPDNTTPLHGRQSENSGQKAKPVKWPSERRAMTVDLLSRR